MKAYTFKINGKEYNVVINSVEGRTADVSVNGASYKVDLGEETAAPAPAAAPKAAQPVQAAPAAPAASPAPAASGAAVTVKSPMEGNVVDVCAKPGDAVKSGQKLVVIEAMKMEVEISATQDGTVREILVNKGDHLVENQSVATLA